MKTKLFRKNNQRRTILSRVAHLSCLLLLLTATFCVAAQNGVTVSGLVINAGTATFNVSWDKNNVPEVWSDTVWVFVDYNDAGVMKRLPLLPGATLTAHTAPDDVGKVIEVPGNADGVWVVGNARSAGTFSATVRAGFKPAPTGGVCVYASNHPPVGEYTSATNISFTGTPPYDIVLKHTGGSTVVTQSGSNFYVPASYTVESFTDKTGAPGIFVCVPPAITAQPASTSVICSGGTVSLSVTASNATAWQWKKNGDNITNEGSGYTTANYTTAALTANATYTVVVSNGACSATSSNALVTVNAVPAVPTGASANSRCGSGTVTFSATVPEGHTIDWYDASGAGSIVDGGSGVTSFSPTLTDTTTYYAQARNTTVATCVSASRLAVKGTVGAYSGSGSAPGTCGCAEGLIDCSGTCLSSCWTDCSGFTQVSSVSYEGSTTMSWSTANTFCQNKGTGWRLPTVSELQCMCSSKSSLPGGYVGDGYWSRTAYNSRAYYLVTFDTCGTYADGVYTDIDYNRYTRYVKCVK